MPIAEANFPIQNLTRKEIYEYIDKTAWKRIGISANELLRSYREGALEDPGAVADLLILADLLPDDDPVFA